MADQDARSMRPPGDWDSTRRGSPRLEGLPLAIVEDDHDTSFVLKTILEREGFVVRAYESAEAALEGVHRSKPRLLLLDLNLPGMDGLDLFRELRRAEATSDIPVIMLSARVEEVDRIVGLSLGADDYVTKPFNPRELVLRVRAVLRPQRTPSKNARRAELRAGGLALYPDEHLLAMDGEELVLTPTECRLLHMLMQRTNRVQTRGALIEAIWGSARDIETRTLDVHVHRLRRKLGRHAPRLETAPGLGYIFRG